MHDRPPPTKALVPPTDVLTPPQILLANTVPEEAYTLPVIVRVPVPAEPVIDRPVPLIAPPEMVPVAALIDVPVIAPAFIVLVPALSDPAASVIAFAPVPAIIDVPVIAPPEMVPVAPALRELPVMAPAFIVLVPALRDPPATTTAFAPEPTRSPSVHNRPGPGFVCRPAYGARQDNPAETEALSARREPVIFMPPSAESRPVADIAPLETTVAPVTVDVEERPPFAEIRPLAVMVPVDTTPVINFMLFCVSWSKPPIFPPLLFRHIR